MRLDIVSREVRLKGMERRSRKKSKQRASAPVCVFCKRSGAGVQFAMFNPRFQPFGTACTDCEAILPADTTVPTEEVSK